MDGATTYLTLPEAAGICPGSPKPDTIRRWINRGVRGVTLRAVFSGRWFTTGPWLRQFLEARDASRLSARRHESASIEATNQAFEQLRKWGLDV